MLVILYYDLPVLLKFTNIFRDFTVAAVLIGDCWGSLVSFRWFPNKVGILLFLMALVLEWVKTMGESHAHLALINPCQAWRLSAYSVIPSVTPRSFSSFEKYRLLPLRW